jgi:hypothetical protein
MRYRVSWGLPLDQDVVGVRIRYAIPPGTVGYGAPYDELDPVSSTILPLPNTPLIKGGLTIEVSTVDDQGNESLIYSATENVNLIERATTEIIPTFVVVSKSGLILETTGKSLAISSSGKELAISLMAPSLLKAGPKVLDYEVRP